MRTTKLVIAALVVPAALAAQLPTGFIPRSIALGGSYTSLARGWEAAFSNPAMLGATGRPSFTLGLPNVRVETGSNSYTLSDFEKYANKTLDSADKAYLLHQITRDDSVLTIRGIVAAAPVGISFGSIALSAYTTGQVEGSLGADAVELALYGNAERSGPGQYFTANGSGGTGWAATVLAGSFALPIGETALGRLALGVTYKRVLGHALGRAGVLSSKFQVNPNFVARAEGQAIYTDEGGSCGSRSFSLSASADPCSLNAGSGYGVDFGAVLQRGPNLTLSAVLVNALASMTWNTDRLVYEYTLDTLAERPDGGVDTLSESRTLRGAAIAGDPIARTMRDSLLANSGFSQLVRVGASLRKGWITLSAGGSVRIKQGLDEQPAQTISAGGELRLLHILPIRAGISSDLSNTVVLSAGSGIQLLGVNLDASIASISGSNRPGVIVGLGASLIW